MEGVLEGLRDNLDDVVHCTLRIRGENHSWLLPHEVSEELILELSLLSVVGDW